MSDMLVKLYQAFPPFDDSALREAGVSLKQGLALERQAICAFVGEQFGALCAGWVDECAAALLRQPSACFIAVWQGEVVGFCCYDSTAKGMLGPLGVRADFRRRGLARALLRMCLDAMKAAGYAYAVIGWVSSEDFYRKACNAIPIADSFPGAYSRMIGQPNA